MTVNELIEKLNTFDGSLEVKTSDHYQGQQFDIDNVTEEVSSNRRDKGSKIVLID